MVDLDRLLGGDVSRAAAEAAESPDFDSIRRRGLERRRNHALLTAAATVAIVGAIAAGGTLFAGTERGDQLINPGPTSPTWPSLPSGDGTQSQAIEPGTYRVPSSGWSAVDFTITFPEEWTVQYGHIYHRGAKEEITLEAAAVEEVYSDACGDDGTLEPVGPGVPDLVAALQSQRGIATSRPVSTTVGGFAATRIDLTIPERLDLATCRFADDGIRAVQVWYSASADNYLVVFPDAVVSVYVVDVDGERQVFVSQSRSASAEHKRELRQVLDSIRIEE